MSKLSKNFSRSEFRCKCEQYCGGTHDFVDAELIYVLEKLRKRFGGKIVDINSGCRCSGHNRDEGGSPNSQHIFGKAADIVVVGIHPDVVADYLEKEYPDRYGIGRYNGRIHIDIRSGKARWDKRTNYGTTRVS
jgi:uncharacterized protein YcbK (DUF882 family)